MEPTLKEIVEESQRIQWEKDFYMEFNDGRLRMGRNGENVR
jgi:hypothetical protein